MKRRRCVGGMLMECLVSLAILASVLTGMVAIQHRINRLRSEMSTESMILDEVQAAKELISSWPIEKVTAEEATKLEISKDLLERLPDATWKIQVESAGPPFVGKQVFIGIGVENQERKRLPVGLTFWVLEKESNSP